MYVLHQLRELTATVESQTEWINGVGMTIIQRRDTEQDGHYL